MTDNNENFFKRLFGNKNKADNTNAAENNEQPEMPDALKAVFNAMNEAGLKPVSNEDMPPEIRAIIESLRASGANVQAINVGNDDCDCPKGHPQCGKTDLESLIEWVKKFTVRVIHDPEDPEMDYFAEEDVRLAMFASARLGELAALQNGVNIKEVAFARAVAHSIIGNTGEILNAEDLRIDLSKTEVPDTIPADWKTDE